jgi:hypothetical protein
MTISQMKQGRMSVDSHVPLKFIVKRFDRFSRSDVLNAARS